MPDQEPDPDPWCQEASGESVPPPPEVVYVQAYVNEEE